MAENPFESFLTGMIGGATAGARRRTMVEQGKQAAGAAEDFFGGGPIDPPKAPGMGATFLAGLQLARTLPTTPGQKIQADQVKLQAANYALQNSIREKEYKLRQQNQILDEAEYNAKLQQSIDDNLGFRTANEEILRMLDNDDIDGIRAFKAPKGMSLSGQQQIGKLKKDALATKQAERELEYRDIKSKLIADYSYTEENLPRDFFTAKTTLEKLTGMRETQEKLQAAEATQIRAEELGSDSYTLQTPGGSITVRKVDKEEADNYTRVQLGEEIRAANAAVARAMADDNADTKAVAILEDNLETLVNMAKARGFPEIIPGQLQDSPPPSPIEETGLGDYDEFLKTQSQYIDSNIKNF